jgi:CRP/FNR family transcriptional regulator, cyclic AMP receptor protein
MLNQFEKPDLESSESLADRRQGDDRRRDGKKSQCEFGSKAFQANDILLSEGETGEEAYLIRSGRVEIRKGSLSNNPMVVATVGKGDVIGEMSLVNDQPHTMSVVAIEETHVAVISKQEFKRRFDVMDPIMKGVLKIIVERFCLVTEQSGKLEEVNWHDWNKVN